MTTKRKPKAKPAAGAGKEITFPTGPGVEIVGKPGLTFARLMHESEADDLSDEEEKETADALFSGVDFVAQVHVNDVSNVRTLPSGDFARLPSPLFSGARHPHIGQQVRFARYDRSGDLLETNAWIHAVHPATAEETDEEMQARDETRFRRGAEPETVDLFYDWPDEPFRRYAERVPYSAEPSESTWNYRGEGK